MHPVGFRLAVKHRKRVESLIIQNGNAYDEGLRGFLEAIKSVLEKPNSAENAKALKGLLTIDATKWQYTHGVRNTETISPDNWGHVQPLLDRTWKSRNPAWPCSSTTAAIQLAIPKWQAYMRQAPTSDTNRLGPK